MALSTKNVKVKALPRTIEPGIRVVKINAISLKPAKFPEDGDPLDLILHIEGVDQGDNWEGWLIDRNDESKGRYKGQTGRVRATRYPFSNGNYPGGEPIIRDERILGFIKLLAFELGVTRQLDCVETATIEEFVNAASPILAGTDQWLNMCLCGREYNSNGFTNFDLYLPKPQNGQKPFENAEREPSKILQFRDDMILRKSASMSVESYQAPVDDGFDLPF